MNGAGEERCPHHFVCRPPWEAGPDGAVEAVCRRCGERRRLSVRLLQGGHEETWQPREDGHPTTREDRR